MKRTRPELRLIVLAVSAAFADCALAQTTPSFNSTQAGAATVSQTGVSTTVSQTSQRAVLLWNSLSLGNGASLTYNQPNATAIAVNRVSASGGQSQIDGSLTANGNVVILNPNGVFFGATASVSVAGLVASTGDINPANGFSEFMTGTTFGITGATAGSVANQGHITITGAGLAAFVAPSVSNAGVITATSGRIRLASAEAANVSTVSLNGGLYEIAVTKGTTNGSINNTGTLSAASGTIVLSALDAANLVSGAINLEGIIQASRIEVDGGQVTLKSDLNAATVAGTSRAVTVLASAQIQDGIDIAATGATVNVAAGTFTQASQLNVNKSITLAGAGQANTTIDARGVSSGYGMLVTADNVTLHDFTFYGPNRTLNASSAYGIKVQPAGSGPSARLLNFSIANVTTRGASRAELDLNGVVGATIDHVTANGAPVGNDSGSTAGAGIQITDSANVTISNSTTMNNQWGGVALYQSNRFFNQQTTGITVQNNNTFTETLPLYMQDESTSLNFGTLSLQGFNYAVQNSSTTNGNNQYTWMQYTLGGAFDFAVNVPDATQSTIQGWNVSASNGSFYVGVGHLLAGGTQNMSIMKAIDTAVSGNTINIAPGNYTEIAMNRTIPGTGGTYNLGLYVNKDNLTLRGIDASGNPITSADQVQAWITAGASTNFGMNNGVSANNVTFQGLGFKPNVAGANKTIEIAGDNFTFANSVVDNRSVPGGAGALYFGELDPTGHPMTRLNVVGSTFYDGSVVLTNGVGADGSTYSAASNRVISGNNFVGSSNYTFGGLLLNGQMAEIPWRTMPIGAATITGNRFSGFDESVLVRGDQQGVDLRQVMATNSFDRAVLVTDSSGNARGELYQSTPDDVHFTPRLKYSIESSLQAGVNRAVSGDTVAVGAGTYAENVVVGKPLNFVFSGPTVQSIVFNSNTGIAGSATAAGAGFTFNAPVTLTGNTSLVTMGGNIAFNGDIQNIGTAPFSLSLSAGMGDVMMLSGGSQANPIGFFSIGANDFSLGSTLWVTGFNVGASGNIALSEHSLHATSTGSANVLVATGDITGATFSQAPVVVNAGGDVVLIIAAPIGTTIKAVGTASVQNVGESVIDVNGVPQVNTQRSVNLTNNRVVPPDNALPGTNQTPSQLQPAPQSTPLASLTSREIPLPAEAAGEALDQGFPVEIDLTPGPKRRN